jgi:hypothetical protein
MGKVIRITESQLKDIVGKVLSEQTSPIGWTDPFKYQQQQADIKGQEQSKKRIDNIANTYSTVNKDGVIVNPNSSVNNMKWMDYVTKYKITPEEQLAAKSLIGQRKTTQDTQNQRYINIANIFHSVDPATLKIKSNNPKLNGMSWSQYMDTYKISQDEVYKAVSYSNSLKNTKADTTPGATPAKTGAVRKSDPKVLALQKSLGFTGKDLDGVMGPKTRAAMASKKGGSTQMKYDASGKPVTPGTRGGQTEMGDTSKGNYEQYAWDNQSGSWILAQDWRKKNGTIPTTRSLKTPSTMDTSKLAQTPTIQGPQSNVSAERRQEIASNVEKQAGTGRIMYKGGDLNPEEQQFLNTYVQSLGGGDMAKSKDKEYGQKIVYKN